jgi:hypothetical protein
MSEADPVPDAPTSEASPYEASLKNAWALTADVREKKRLAVLALLA